MSGESSGRFFYYQNTGTATAPAFAALQVNPFGLTDVGSLSNPCLTDLDGDGDIDLLSTEFSGNFPYFENIGTASSPAFSAVQVNPFGLYNLSFRTSSALIDLDKDGDLDIMTGTDLGYFKYSENIGTANAPAFAAPLTNAFGFSDIGGLACHPSCADLDGDGDMDFVAGENYGGFVYFENITTCYGLTVFADADGDGYGDPALSIFATECMMPSGYAENNEDCNDANSAINPAAAEICGNNIDDNCNGTADENCTACETPGVLITTNITASSATTHWNVSAGALAYQVRYKPVVGGSWTKIETLPASTTITGLSANTTYVWIVRSICDANPTITSDWSVKKHFKTQLRLSGEEMGTNSFSVYPNPTQDQTTIHYTLLHSSHVSIKVYDMSGKEVQTLMDGVSDNGDHSLELNTGQFAKGVYLVKMISDSGIENQKLIVQ